MEYTNTYDLEEKKKIHLSIGRIGNFYLGKISDNQIKVVFSAPRDDVKKLFKAEYIHIGEQLDICLKKHRNAIKASLGRSLSMEVYLPYDYVKEVSLQVTADKLVIEEEISYVELKEGRC